MPKYAYKCKECGNIFEATHSMSERLTDCENCNKIDTLLRLPSTIATQFRDSEVGKTVENYIEEAKEEVREEKQRLQEQDWET